MGRDGAYYDLNISVEFKDLAEFEAVDAKGYCMALSTENAKTAELFTPPEAAKPIYTRVNIEYQKGLDQSVISALRKFDLVCVKNVDSSNIASVVKLDPDLICLKTDEIRHMKKSLINTLKEKKLYVEVLLRDALYTSKERILWMNSIRRLLRLGCGKILVVSSGAQVFTELKDSNDICKILGIFGLSADKVKKILKNSEDVLRQAALKRYSANGAIATNEAEGKLKDAFIINYR